MPAPAIETRALTKRYGATRGIEDVSLVVERGEVLGFLGPNGAGKTTMIRTLLDLQHPTGGSARLLGLDSRRDSVAIRARTGNLPADFACDPRWSGRELLTFCAAARGVGVEHGLALAERFETDLDRPFGDLSRGNRQKAGLVQALFHEPELLLLDEPTSGLDPVMREEFLAVIGEERARGATVFLSSHDLDEVQRVCDRVAIIRDGRLAAVEDVADMRGRAYHHVVVTFTGPFDVSALRRIDGVRDVVVDGAEVSLRVHGALDAVVKVLARHTIADLEVTEPSLEELFLAFYSGEATA